MDDKFIVGIISATIVILIREGVAHILMAKKRKKICALCLHHLKIIHEELKTKVKFENDKFWFTETNYCEIVVGDFLYDLISANLDTFSDVSKLEKTIDFFHHYKVNMATVRSRLDECPNKTKLASLTTGTYNNLINRIEAAIKELNVQSIT